MSVPASTIPKGSWVLVSGATGFLASHVVKQFLERGYKVRGTVRNLTTASWVVDDVFKAYAKSGALELVEVPELAADHAFDEAVKGMSAIIHIATISDFNPNPNETITQTVAGVISMLDAAAKEPLMREFVYTSSIAAATTMVEGNKTHVGRDTFNEDSIKLAWAPPPYEPSRGFVVYCASKATAEMEVWKWVDENKPKFNVNVVVPATIIGQPLHKKHYDVHAAPFVKRAYDGATELLTMLPATFLIDVKDVAAIHVAAALDPGVRQERLQAWGRAGNWNDVLALLRKQRPNRKFMPDFPDSPVLSLSTDQSPALDLLKKWVDQDGFKPLEESIAENIKPFA